MDDDEDEAGRHASQRVAGALRADIDSGRYKAGDRLPSVRTLAKEHGVANNTAQAAVRLLAAEGRVSIRQSAGAFVADDAEQERTTVTVTREELEAVRRQVERARRALAEADRALSNLSDSAP